MSIPLPSLTNLPDLPFDEVIDVRSPAEFAEDHIPGAVNLPVLSNEERAEVGTIYVQDSRFRARKIGAALVARNAAAHLQTYLADKPGGYRPLVYCWRGGQRSGSFALILSQVGWRAETLEGGYQTYRRAVVEQLYHQPFPARIVVLDGNTGTAKTDMLAHLAAQGVQVIDLEGLANHRGSVFGARGGQPSQKMFEGYLAQEVVALDPTRPVVVEAESSKIGALSLPPTLWKAMVDAPRLRLSAPLSARASYLTRAYADIVADEARLREVLARLVPMHGHEKIHDWQRLAQSGAFEELAAALMAEHYDPRYEKQRGRIDGRAEEVITLDSLTDSALATAAPGIAAAVVRISG
ncbi:tRNA 2-selenouridine synthase [Rubricella aquisinus]|uniref:tRNA 2-selenouridine synthase n=1 Tax=Rubricella aquisinus TaxID=2028108 RepID=A0A840WS10_9RHOB|nr:tRNA 2-selenouridine(34) synthase MnmH [Rubricella aquisinus]MBB5516813.1 tRNA 2-selenouridine synthase [Rubricella aquisinus]